MSTHWLASPGGLGWNDTSSRRCLDSPKATSLLLKSGIGNKVGTDNTFNFAKTDGLATKLQEHLDTMKTSLEQCELFKDAVEGEAENVHIGAWVVKFFVVRIQATATTTITNTTTRHVTEHNVYCRTVQLAILSGDTEDVGNLLHITQTADIHYKSIQKVQNICTRIKEIHRLKAMPLDSQEDNDDE